MAKHTARAGGLERFLSRVRNFVSFLLDPDTRCLLRLAWQDFLKNASRSAADPVARKKHRTRAAKAS